jgi:hypothetical protein
VERNHCLYFINHLNALQNGRNHGLSKENLRKFQIKCKFWQLFWMKFINSLVEFLLITTLATVCLCVYISQVYDYYFAILLMGFLLGTYIIVRTLPIYTLGEVIIYCTALYLRLRFQQITQQFQRISAKNLSSLQSLIREHNRVSVMTENCNTLFSKIFGVHYFYMPFIVNLLLCIAIYGKSSVYIRSISAILAVFTSIGMYLFSYIPTQVSTEAHRSYNTINSINARYQMQLQTKFKVSFFRRISISYKEFSYFPIVDCIY